MIALEEVKFAEELAGGFEAGHHLVGGREDAAVTLDTLVEVPQVTYEAQFLFFFVLGHKASRTYPLGGLVCRDALYHALSYEFLDFFLHFFFPVKWIFTRSASKKWFCSCVQLHVHRWTCEHLSTV